MYIQSTWKWLRVKSRQILTRISLLLYKKVGRTLLFIFVVSLNHIFSASLETPEEQWRYETKESPIYPVISFSPERKKVLLKSRYDHLYCFDIKGRLIWTFDGVFDFVAYDYKSDRTFCDAFCLDSLGNILWRYEIEERVETLSFKDAVNRIFLGTTDGYLHCLNIDGILLWKVPLGGSLDAFEKGDPPIFYDRKNERILVVVGKKGLLGSYLYCLDLEGREIWKYAIQDIFVCSTSYDSKSGKLFCGLFDGKLLCIDAKGEKLWTYQVIGQINGIACDAEQERIFFGSGDNYLTCLDFDGAVVWKNKTDDWFQGVAYDPKSNRIFCESWDEYMYCLSSDGSYRWKYPMGEPTNKINIDSDHFLIFVPLNNGICCIDYYSPLIDMENEIKMLNDQLSVAYKENEDLKKDLNFLIQTLLSFKLDSFAIKE